MRKTQPFILAALLLLAGAGCNPVTPPTINVQPTPTPVPPAATDTDTSADETHETTVTLNEQNGSRESGTVTLTSMTEGTTRVVITLANAPKDTPQPAHIHVGSCPNPGTVSVPLNNVVNGKSETLVTASLASLLNATTALAINVHKSEAEPSVYVACGNLP